MENLYEMDEDDLPNCCEECGMNLLIVYKDGGLCKECWEEIQADFKFDQRRDDKLTGDQ
jgi:hypothetical protein